MICWRDPDPARIATGQARSPNTVSEVVDTLTTRLGTEEDGCVTEELSLALAN